MRTTALLLAFLVAPAALPGAQAHRACAAAGPYWPTQTLAMTSGVAWVACKEEGRLVRVPLPSGRLRSVALDGQPIAVVAAFGALWALDTAGTVSRIDPRTNQVTGRVRTGSAAPYNLWAGAGSLWSVDDRSGEVVRIDPVRRVVTARIAVGDGPADLVFSGSSAWVVNHRDRSLVLIDTATNKARKLAVLAGDAPERIALLADSLWITGRGTDLLRVDPATGATRATIEIGAGGIDVVASAGSLWVPARAAAADRRGFPTMSALRRVDPGGRVRTVLRVSKRVDVHGLVRYRSGVLFADNTGGTLYAVPG